jgi:hypothetical protein
MTEQTPGSPVYTWRDHSRFVDIFAVKTGWLIVWGMYEHAGKRKLIYGNQVYRDQVGLRRRLAATIIELTANPAHAEDALALLDRQGLPAHESGPLPEPLAVELQ